MEPKRQKLDDFEDDEDMPTAHDGTLQPNAHHHTQQTTTATAPLPPPTLPPISSAADNFSPELLRLYYDRIFPANLMCRWLSYGTQHAADPARKLLNRREFSFTTGDDIYIRYLSFEDAAGLKKELLQKLPHKIDIGAVFSAAPRDHKKYKLFEPLQREFIIDIDLTDYDFLEVDVKRLETCDRCWPLMALAMRVLNTALVLDFGFEDMLWVYSGRRGIHCWACDGRSRRMSNEVRGAVADYLGPRIDAASGRMRVSTPMHPSLRRAYEHELEPFFKKTMLGAEAEGGFGILDTPERREKVLALLGDTATSERVSDEWARKPAMSGEERWAALVRHGKPAKLGHTITEIIFTFTYPRLDVNVSKGMNHLLKSPWCVHPKTGRVCVTVNPAESADFDPSGVPTLRHIAEDIDNAGSDAADAGSRLISKTRLAKYEESFDVFLSKMEGRIRAEQLNDKRATETLDF
jgi:DNA primase small subunit